MQRRWYRCDLKLLVTWGAEHLSVVAGTPGSKGKEPRKAGVLSWI